MSTEIEYKFKITPDQIEQLKHQELLSGMKPTVQIIHNTYFDTPDFNLFHQKIVLRIREIAGEYYQTLKLPGLSQNGFSKRQEWEYPLSKNQFDFSLFPEQIQNILPPLKQLQAHIQIDFQRTIYLIHLSKNLEIELAIDQGSIRANDQMLPISEVELELKSGSESAFKTFVLHFQKNLQLIPEPQSKSKRGFSFISLLLT